jgi:hypothetical protein
MKRIFVLLALLAAGRSAAQAAPPLNNSAAASRVLMIDSSSMPLGGGSATLIIGALRRADGVYSGDYRIKVFPYFLKNEKGRLAINVSDASLAEVNAGKVAAITGTATTSGKDGQSRPIEATATPADLNRGKLKLWFMAGDRKMTFEPAYHFAEVGTAFVRQPMTAASLAVRPQCQVATLPPKDRKTAAIHL